MLDRIRNTAVACALLVMGSIPAYAQEQSAFSASRTRETVKKYGECIVGRNAALSRGVILADIHRQSLSQQAPKLFDPDCLIGLSMGPERYGVAFPGDTPLYAIAEALMRKDYATVGTWDFASRPPLDHRKPELVLAAVNKRRAPVPEKPIDPAEIQASIDAFHILAQWGECVVRRDPTAVHTLLLAEPSSQDEQRAFEALKEPFGLCLGDGEVALSRQNARGTLAVNFYRLAGAPTGASVKTPKVN